MIPSPTTPDTTIILIPIGLLKARGVKTKANENRHACIVPLVKTGINIFLGLTFFIYFFIKTGKIHYTYLNETYFDCVLNFFIISYNSFYQYF